MPNRVKRHCDFLKYLCHCTPNQRKILLKSATPEQIDAICECVYNLYLRNVEVDRKTVKKLIPHKKVLVKLAKNQPKLALSKRRKLLVQKGGSFLPILLSAILPTVLGSIFPK
jgi:hypothetical protein